MVDSPRARADTIRELRQRASDLELEHKSRLAAEIKSGVVVCPEPFCAAMPGEQCVTRFGKPTHDHWHRRGSGSATTR